MKKLVVYYSLDGNTRFIAHAIAGALEADLLEIKPASQPDPKNFMKYFWGGKQVFKKEKPILLPLEKDPADYDAFFIGTPVWAWNYAPALGSFFDMANLHGKKIGLFCCSAGGEGKTLDRMKERLSGNDIIGTKGFVDPLKHDKDKDAEAAREWARTALEQERGGVL